MEIAAEIVQSHTSLPKESLLQNFLAQPGYATVKVDVRGAVIRDERILLVQERSDGLWCMPGGWADVGTIPSEMVVREVWEESGFNVIPRKIIGIYDANRSGIPLEFYHAYKIVFWCDITAGNPRASSETLAVDFFRFDDLPPLSTNRTHERHLSEVLAHIGDPNRPATFD
jgi:ADP-ribose pyrophosphatase YjhB (NUDIX family)